MPTVNEPELPSPDHERPADALLEQMEWLRVTLASIGDAVITVDPAGLVTFLNTVAESLTGWKSSEAAGVPLKNVFPIVNENNRLKAENPASRVLRVGLYESSLGGWVPGFVCPGSDWSYGGR